MDRLSRCARVLACLAITPLALAGAAAADAGVVQRQTREAVVTIAFSGSGAVPLVCTTRPDATPHTIQSGERIILANFTGVEATIDTGPETLTIADGDGVSVRLTQGQHELRMVPKCVVILGAEAAVVTVQAPPTPTPTPTSPGPSAPPAEVGSGRNGAGGSGSSANPGAAGNPRSTTPAPASGPATLPAGDTVALAASEPSIYHVEAVAVVGPNDERGGRLLAVIAAICMLGVTAAIIRAILSQRASGVVST